MMAFVLMALMAVVVVVAINLYRAWRRDQSVDRAQQWPRRWFD